MNRKEFAATSTGRLIQAMKDTGDAPGIVSGWRTLMEHWANTHEGPDAKAMQAWLPNFVVRPFYSARELVPMFPALACAFGMAERIMPQMSSARLAHLLDFGGLPRIENASGGYEFWHPMTADVSFSSRYRDTFYIVERIAYWKKRELSQLQFNAICRGEMIG